MKKEVILSGFGGQGVMSIGKNLVEAAVAEDLEASWVPSYGPEMRGGTANCSVCISDKPIGSPLVTSPNVLVAMNLPSLEKFIGTVQPGGLVILDSSLIQTEIARGDVSVHRVPSSSLAEEKGLSGLSNMILVGKLFQELDFCPAETLDEAIQKCVSARRPQMLELNRQAVALGAAQ